MNTKTTATGQSRDAQESRAQAKHLGALFAVMFGAFLIWGTGYANANLLHSSAHDARHALGFPCH